MDENVTALLMALIFVSFVLTLILAMKSEADKTNDRDLVVELQKHVYQVAEEYGLDWTLLMAVIQKESRFDPYAVSSTNDYGLMQINAVNHARLSVEVGVHDFLDPRENVRAGAYMLSQLLSRYQDVHMALMAYNFGKLVLVGRSKDE